MKTQHLAIVLLVIAAVCMGSTCSSSVVRDAKVYRTELDLMEQMAVQPADSLDGFVKNHCKCTDGKWSDDTCRKAAKLILVVKTRVPYHKLMMLYNAGLLKERPPKDPPDVPAAETLCP